MTDPRRRSLRLELIATLSVILMMAVVSLSLATELLGRRRHAEAQRQQLSSHVQGLSALVMPRLGSANEVDRDEIIALASQLAQPPKIYQAKRSRSQFQLELCLTRLGAV